MEREGEESKLEMHVMHIVWLLKGIASSLLLATSKGRLASLDNCMSFVHSIITTFAIFQGFPLEMHPQWQSHGTVP